MRKYRNIKYNNIPRRITKYSEEWIEYRKHRGSNSVKVEHCDINEDGFDDSIVRDYRSPALKKLQTCGPILPETGPSSLSAALGKTSFGPSNLNVIVQPRAITTTPGYVDYYSLSWTVEYLGDFSDMDNYAYSISTSATDVPSFEAAIIETKDFSSQRYSVVFSNLNSNETYYFRVKATGPNGAVYSTFSANMTGLETSPCQDFSATRQDDGDGTSSLSITTNLPNENVTVSEELNNSNIAGLVRPIANDQFGNLWLAVGEGRGIDATGTQGGRVVFDTGFPKFYRSFEAPYDPSYMTDPWGPGTPGKVGYLINSINYTSRTTNKTNKVMFFNDDSQRGKHRYRSSNFWDFFNAATVNAGKTLSYFKDISSDGGHYDWFIDVRYDQNETVASYKAYFNEFDTIIYTGTDGVNGNVSYLSDNFKNALLEYVDEGGGLIVITDHDIFQVVVNPIVAHFGIQFTDTVPRSPSNTAYKVSTILGNSNYIPSGFHPLFENLSPDSYIQAGASEGTIVYYDSASGLTSTANPSPTARTSNYVSDANGALSVTAHTDAYSTDLAKGKIIVRTASGCGEVFPAIP